MAFKIILLLAGLVFVSVIFALFENYVSSRNGNN